MSKAYPPVLPIFQPDSAAKPLSVNNLGVVLFTDRSLNDIQPNEGQCLSYGYTFDKATNTCRAFQPTNALQTSLRTEDNTVSGQGNTIGIGTTNTYVMGVKNTIIGNSRNNIVVGNNNTIAEYVDNANVYGTLGEATAINSIVLGGNAAGDNLGERQTMTFMYGCQTTDGSTVDAFLNNTTDSYFVVPTDTAIYFQSETLVVRVGGSAAAGSVGDFKSWVERGVVINKSGTLSIARSRTSPASSGTTTSWSPVNDVSGTNFLQTVTGKADMTLEWASTIRMTQIKTGVAL